MVQGVRLLWSALERQAAGPGPAVGPLGPPSLSADKAIPDLCPLGRPLETRRVAGRLAPQPAAAGLVHNSARRVLNPGRARLFSRLFSRKNPGLLLLPGLVSGSSLR